VWTDARLSLSLSLSLERLVQVFGSAPRCLASGSGSLASASLAPSASATASAPEFDTAPEFARRLSGPAPGPFLALLVQTYLLYSYMSANSEREGGAGRRQRHIERPPLCLCRRLSTLLATCQSISHSPTHSPRIYAPPSRCRCVCMCVERERLLAGVFWRMVTDVGCRSCGRICGRSDSCQAS
jgi:hypothetical protein